MKHLTTSKLIPAGIAVLFGVIALQIPFTRLLGANVKFTLFDFVAPIAGSFLGTLPGILTVCISELINVFMNGLQAFNSASIIRLLPILFATAYFAKKRTFSLIVPLLAIVVFNSHPIGRSAWQYSLFWFIPVAAYFFHRNIFARSMGATFTAHAVGGALWVWTFGLTKEMWLALIPQVAMERTLMAAGIAVSYVVTKWAVTHAGSLKIFSSKPAQITNPGSRPSKHD